jgi:regulator of protease activity HflC (stomatin/prohibitin superfamily)
MNELLIALIAVAAVLAAVLFKPARTTVFEYERGLEFSRGRFRGVLSPGSYLRLPGRTVFQRIDVRSTRLAVSGQEVLTSDGVAIKTSIAAAYHVADPAKAILGTESYQIAIHTELQLALRGITSGMPIEDLLKRRGELPAQLKEIAAPRLREIGIELEDASLRDLTFPGELKKIFAQVVKARQEGLAALEKARGETAALRNLANAAQLVERTPSLMQLRALQVLVQQPGNTLVLGMGGAATPIPLRATTEPQIPSAAEPPGDASDGVD